MTKKQLYKWACIINAGAVIIILAISFYCLSIASGEASFYNIEAFCTAFLIGAVYLVIDLLGMQIVKKLDTATIFSEKKKKTIGIFYIIECIFIVPGPLTLSLIAISKVEGEYYNKIIVMGISLLILASSIIHLILTKKLVRMTEENYQALQVAQ